MWYLTAYTVLATLIGVVIGHSISRPNECPAKSQDRLSLIGEYEFSSARRKKRVIDRVRKTKPVSGIGRNPEKVGTAEHDLPRPVRTVRIQPYFDDVWRERVQIYWGSFRAATPGDLRMYGTQRLRSLIKSLEGQ